ncbi:hypothetical protein [Candidatus Lokiarchaeum ossiferum]|uniref:hypothetical protein n=1 Tax=Candidatus Lokiarchaeum ossiferum TaxID=2951803 RepID=UPI00352C5E0B
MEQNSGINVLKKDMKFLTIFGVFISIGIIVMFISKSEIILIIFSGALLLLFLILPFVYIYQEKEKK